MRATVLAIVLVLIAATGQAASVQARLIRASTKTAASDEKLRDFVPKLKAVFGYGRYDQLGTDQAIVEKGKRLKLYPGEGFTTFVHPKGLDGKTHEMEVELYSGRTLVTKATVKIPVNSSVFIKGPEVGDTLIIVSLTVVE